MQWNARSAMSNKLSLQNFLQSENIDIALISETWFKHNININFCGYNLIRKDRYDGKAGVAILINKKLIFKEIKISNNFHDSILVCCAEVSCNETPITFLSIYRPPNIGSTTNDWMNIFKQIHPPLIIGGDFNAHNYLWGSNRNDPVGLQIIHAIDELELVVLNTGPSTRLDRPGIQKSVVDLSLASTDIANKITWNVFPDCLGSDHFPLMMKLESIHHKNEYIFPKSKWNLNKANWPLYTQLLTNFFEAPPTY